MLQVTETKFLLLEFQYMILSSRSYSKSRKQAYPEGSFELGVRQLSGKSQVLICDVVKGSLIPRKQDSHLKSCDVQIKTSSLVGKCDLENQYHSRSTSRIEST